MIKRVDHVSIAVRNLDEAKAFFVDGLGGKELFSAPAEGQGFHWTTIELGTSCLIELVNPIDDGGFVQRFLDERGEGAHHITIHVDNAKETEAALNARGVPTFGYNAIPPVWTEFFVHPKNAFGTLLQFAEFNPLDWINPGYVPKAYAEFRPGPEATAGGGHSVDVRHEGPLVELTDATSSIRLERKDLPDLIRRLQEAAL